MSEGVFAAEYVDFRNIRTRRTVQFVFEVPIEQFETAYAVLGPPRPGAEQWVAIGVLSPDAVAAIKADRSGVPSPVQSPPAQPDPEPEPSIAAPQPAPAPPEDKPRRHWSDMPASTRAAMCCGDPKFQKWLHQLGRIPEETEEAATAYVRRIAGGSRANLGKPGHEQQTSAWEIIDRAYAKYLDELRYGAH